MMHHLSSLPSASTITRRWSLLFPSRTTMTRNKSLGIASSGKIAQRNGNNNGTTRGQLVVVRSSSSDHKKKQFSRTSTSTTTTPSSSEALQQKQSSSTPVVPPPPTKNKAVLPLWIVEHPGTTAAVPVLGNLAYVTLAGGFLCSDVLSLRVLLIGGYSGLVAYHALRSTAPLMIPLRWSAFFVMVNASMAALLIMENMPPTLTEEEEELHVRHFAPLSRRQFRALMDIGTKVTYGDGEYLTKANEPCNKLFFILGGTAIMTNGETGKHASTLQRGGFPNCMSFQRSGWRHGSDDSGSYGTIRCEGPVTCIVWEAGDLLALLSKNGNDNDDMRLRMDHAVIEAVIRRLLVDAEGAKVTDYIRVISKGWAHDSLQERKIQSMQSKEIVKRAGPGSEESR